MMCLCLFFLGCSEEDDLVPEGAESTCEELDGLFPIFVLSLIFCGLGVSAVGVGVEAGVGLADVGADVAAGDLIGADPENDDLTGTGGGRDGAAAGVDVDTTPSIGVGFSMTRVGAGEGART